MFQSYEYQKYLGFDPETKLNRWQFKIIDSDFEEVVVVVEVGVGVSIIEVYEKRNLNVAANLIKFILYLHKKYPHYSIQHFIEDNRKYNPKFAQYEGDIEKYMVLL